MGKRFVLLLLAFSLLLTLAACTIELKNDKSTNNSPVKTDGDLKAGDTIETGTGQRKTYTISDGRYLLAEENTSAKVVTLSKETLIEVLSGKIWLNIERKLGGDETFIVKTAVSALSAKGTVFSVSPDGEETTFAVYEGTVNATALKADGSAITDENGNIYSYDVSSAVSSLTVNNGEVIDSTLDPLGEDELLPLYSGSGGNEDVQAFAPQLAWTDESLLTLTVYPGMIELAPGASLPLYVYPSKGVVWVSDYPEVATVDASGKVTAVAEGETVITAKSGGKEAYCLVRVIADSPTLMFNYPGPGSGGDGDDGDDGDGGGDSGDSGDGGGDSGNGDSFTPPDIPVGHDPELDIPVEKMKKLDEFDWMISIFDNQVIQLNTPKGAITATFSLSLSINKNGGKTGAGVYHGTNNSITVLLGEYKNWGVGYWKTEISGQGIMDEITARFDPIVAGSRQYVSYNKVPVHGNAKLSVESSEYSGGFAGGADDMVTINISIENGKAEAYVLLNNGQVVHFNGQLSKWPWRPK